LPFTTPRTEAHPLLKSLLAAAVIALPAIPVARAQTVDPAAAVNDGAWQKIFNLLPPGSELKEIMLPRYDDLQRLSNVLKAKVMTLVNENQIEGKSIVVEFFNPDKTPRGRIDLETATIDKARGLLTTREPVEIRIDGLKAAGTGLYYDLELRKGFITGPATTVIRPRKTRP
jgi:hypothetical protein